MGEWDDQRDQGTDPTGRYSVRVGPAAARVLIAAATTLYREGVLAALRDDDRFLVVGSAQDEREFVWRVVAERPDVALLDMDLLHAAASHGLLPARQEGPRLVVLAVGDREEDISACADAGATEIVRRRAGRDELLAAMDRALHGDSRLESLRDALLVDRLLADAPTESTATAAAMSNGSGLTPRERQILALIEAGKTNKAIALELGCSPATVKNHVHALLAKLGVSRRTEAARLARGALAGTQAGAGE